MIHKLNDANRRTSSPLNLRTHTQNVRVFILMSIYILIDDTQYEYDRNRTGSGIFIGAISTNCA